MSLAVPFMLGTTYWMPTLNPTQVIVTCPVCYGNRTVTVTLGNGEHVAVECDGCGLGHESPQGTVREYTYEPGVKSFTVKAVTSMHGESWWLRAEEGHDSEWSNLYATEDKAWKVSRERMADALADNARRSATSNRKMLSRLAWTVRYHEQCIADMERKIEWHRRKVSERKVSV